VIDKFNLLRNLAPGIMVAVMVGLSAAFLSEHYGAPIMFMALLLGMAFNFMSETPKTSPGLDTTSTLILRIGVALLGVRITLGDLSIVGWLPLLAVIAMVILILALGWMVGKKLKLSEDLGVLAGGAVAICGASATAAIACVVPSRHQNQQIVAFTIIAITSLSSFAMVVYPMIAKWVGLTDLQTAYFLGATIHDVAQVVGAGYGVSEQVGDTATVVKLFRVALLAPIVLVLGLMMAKGEPAGSRFPLPPFLLVFLALMICNSVGWIPELLVHWLTDLSRWCLVFALAAIGMRTHLNRLVLVGAMPMVLIAGETLLLMGLGVATAKWLL